MSILTYNAIEMPPIMLLFPPVFSSLPWLSPEMRRKLQYRITNSSVHGFRVFPIPSNADSDRAYINNQCCYTYVKTKNSEFVNNKKQVV